MAKVSEQATTHTSANTNLVKIIAYFCNYDNVIHLAIPHRTASHPHPQLMSNIRCVAIQEVQASASLS